jgi:hypothetical protein
VTREILELLEHKDLRDLKEILEEHLHLLENLEILII